VEYTREILKAAGMDPDRIQMFHCSAAEGQRFQQEVTRVSEIIENIGKNPIKKLDSKNESKEK
jgi:coenzyme F420-reducing hydrogenase delta subunit